MISYKDTTFCSGAGCTNFKKCPHALTEEVSARAQQWWGNANAPISQFADPTVLECYVPPAEPRGQILLRE